MDKKYINYIELKIPFASALTFRYLCKYEDRMRLGIVKTEITFPFVSALSFRYLCSLNKMNKKRTI